MVPSSRAHGGGQGPWPQHDDWSRRRRSGQLSRRNEGRGSAMRRRRRASWPEDIPPSKPCRRPSTVLPSTGRCPPQTGSPCQGRREPHTRPCIMGSGHQSDPRTGPCGAAAHQEAKGRSGRSQIQVPGMNRDVEGRDTAWGRGSSPVKLPAAHPCACRQHRFGGRPAHLCLRDRLIDRRRSPCRVVRPCPRRRVFPSAENPRPACTWPRCPQPRRILCCPG